MRRKETFGEHVLNALINDINEQEQDHLVISGDITNLALEKEYKRSLKVIEQFTQYNNDQDHRISIVPGNHDAYRRDYEAAYKKYWAPFMHDGGGYKGFPYMKAIDKVALIGVNSGVATKPFKANGIVSPEQGQKLEKLLKKAKNEKLCRVVIVHHPPYKGAVTERKALWEGETFLAPLRKQGAELILSGHAHKIMSGYIDGPSAKIPVRVAGSATTTGKGHSIPGHYHDISINDDAKNWNIKINHRHYNLETEKFEQGATESLNIKHHWAM